MRYWCIWFFQVFLYSVSVEDLRNKFVRKESQEFTMQQDVMQIYLKHSAALAELLRNQKHEPKKNEKLRRLEIHVVAARILEDLEKFDKV